MTLLSASPGFQWEEVWAHLLDDKACTFHEAFQQYLYMAEIMSGEAGLGVRERDWIYARQFLH